MEIKLEVPEDFDEKEPIALVNFTNGQFNPDAATSQSLKMQMTKKPGERNDRKRVLTGETDHITYYGTNYETEDGLYTPNYCKYMIGSLNKKTKVMTLHRADVFNMTPRVKGIPSLSSATPLDGQSLSTTTPLKSQFTKEDYLNTNDKMVLSFGSEKAKRALSAAKRNRMDSSALDSTLMTALNYAEDEMKRTDDGTSTNDTATQSLSFLPTPNSTATQPQDVYQLSDILSDDVMAQLAGPAKTLVRATPEDISNWRAKQSRSEFVLSNSKSILQGASAYKMASILVYCDYLITMYGSSPKEIQRNGLSKLWYIPESVQSYLLSQYTEQGMMTSKMKDKILASLIILALTVTGYSLDMSILQKDLKVTSTKIVDVSKALGCTVTSTKATKGHPKQYTAHLRVPLVFGKPGKGRKRKSGI